MNAPQDDKKEQLQRVRERFTRTADDFARFALAVRSADAERLARLAVEDLPAPVRLALDVACGPGTFARGLARYARFVVGVDYTPAMLAKARHASAESRFANLTFVCGDGNRLPLADASLDLAACGYSFHHFADPARPLREMARVVRRGGRVAVADLIVPEGVGGEANNRIERVRDASHTRTLTADELRNLFEKAGLVVRAAEVGASPRAFDDWMRNVSHPPGSEVYRAVRALMEAQIGRDTTGFQPRWKDGDPGAIEFVQTTIYVVGEKP
jgi:ubiquinone/menaquinone biosynthesis C-methylase UbiE